MKINLIKKINYLFLIFLIFRLNIHFRNFYFQDSNIKVDIFRNSNLKVDIFRNF